jgi:hypothetical protein
MKKSRLALCALVGLLAGFGGETLLFVQRQCRAVEAGLREDFRVMLFLSSDMDAGKQKVIEEQLRALPDVDDVRSVSRQEQLSELRRDDPELVDSVALIGDNPLMPAFEVRLGEGGVAKIAQWLAQAQPLADWADVRYKPAQVQAILQAQFYARFLDLALAALVCLAAALALAGVWVMGKHHGHGAWRRHGFTAAAVSAAGAAAGGALVGVMVLPLKALAPWFSWPTLGGQLALLLAAGSAGWVLCARPE